MLGSTMSHTVDYFASMQKHIDAMTPEQLATMTKKFARMSGAYDVDGGPRVTRALVYTPHKPNQRRTPRTKK